MNGIEWPILSHSDPIQFSQVPPLPPLLDFSSQITLIVDFVVFFWIFRGASSEERDD